MFRWICTTLAILTAFLCLFLSGGRGLPWGTRAALHPAAAEETSTTYSLPHRVLSARANPDMERTMLRLLNRSRLMSGRSPLTRDAALQGVARRYGGELFASGYLSHRSLDGRTPWDRMATAGIRPQYAGENLAYATDVPTAHLLLMNSPEHRYNVLLGDYHRVGIGILDGGNFGIIVVEDFTN